MYALKQNSILRRTFQKNSNDRLHKHVVKKVDKNEVFSTLSERINPCKEWKSSLIYNCEQGRFWNFVNIGASIWCDFGGGLDIFFRRSKNDQISKHHENFGGDRNTDEHSAQMAGRGEASGLLFRFVVLC